MPDDPHAPSRPRWSFPIGTVAGIQIRVHATFFLLVALFALAGSTPGGPGVLPALVWLVADLRLRRVPRAVPLPRRAAPRARRPRDRPAADRRRLPARVVPREPARRVRHGHRGSGRERRASECWRRSTALALSVPLVPIDFAERAAAPAARVAQPAARRVQHDPRVPTRRRSRAPRAPRTSLRHGARHPDRRARRARCSR